MSNPSSPPQNHIGRQLLTWTIKIVVSGGLLYWLFRSQDIKVANLLATVRSASPLWLGVALFLQFAVIAVGTWRWRLLLTAQHVDVPFRSLMNSYLVANFFNQILPSNVGGDVVRIGDTSKPVGSTTLAAMLVLVDRGIGLLGLAFVAAVGASITAWISPTLGPIGPGILWLILAAAIVATGWAVWMPHGVGALLKPLRVLHQEWVGERIEQLMAALHKFRSARSALVIGFAAAVVVQGLLVLFYVSIALALRYEISIADLAVVVPISLVIQMLPVSLGGLGVRESTFVLYLKPFGVAQQSALTLSLTGTILIVLFSLSGAVAYFVRTKKH